MRDQDTVRTIVEFMESEQPYASRTTLMRIHLAMAVPLRILEIRRSPLCWEDRFEPLRAWYMEYFQRYSDQLLHRGPETRKLMDGLTELVALMSFVPGGIELFGLRFESEHYADDVVHSEVTMTRSGA